MRHRAAGGLHFSTITGYYCILKYKQKHNLKLTFSVVKLSQLFHVTEKSCCMLYASTK